MRFDDIAEYAAMIVALQAALAEAHAHLRESRAVMGAMGWHLAER